MSKDESYDSAWVENAAIVETKFEKYNVLQHGFKSFEDFMKWVNKGPIQIELNRDVYEGEELFLFF